LRDGERQGTARDERSLPPQAGRHRGWRGKEGEGSLQEKRRKPVVAEMKARQAAKIRELGQALVDAGFLTLDEQAQALGLARSTTWTILRASHKGSGLSAAIIKRMLLSPQLPPLARRKILEYTTDKLAGAYGGSRTQRLKFFESVKRATLRNSDVFSSIRQNMQDAFNE
jgi:hypothetical protein